MSLPELETAVRKLPAPDLTLFAQWFEEYLADAWDAQIEADAMAGRLDRAASEAKAAYEAGKCTPL
jgi:hypothetical protein